MTIHKTIEVGPAFLEAQVWALVEQGHRWGGTAQNDREAWSHAHGEVVIPRFHKVVMDRPLRLLPRRVGIRAEWGGYKDYNMQVPQGAAWPMDQEGNPLPMVDWEQYDLSGDDGFGVKVRGLSMDGRGEADCMRYRGDDGGGVYDNFFANFKRRGLTLHNARRSPIIGNTFLGQWDPVADDTPPVNTAIFAWRGDACVMGNFYHRVRVGVHSKDQDCWDETGMRSENVRTPYVVENCGMFECRGGVMTTPGHVVMDVEGPRDPLLRCVVIRPRDFGDGTSKPVVVGYAGVRQNGDYKQIIGSHADKKGMVAEFPKG